MNGTTDLPKLKEADELISAEVERLLIENRVWHFNAYGWQNAYDADPEFIGHAMWQVEPAVDFGFNTKITLNPPSPDMWKRQLSISGSDFEGLMRAARNSIGLLLFQISLRPASFVPDGELFDLYKMSSLIYLSTATERLREFFILAAFRETSKQYRSRKRNQFGNKWRERYATPFIEAQSEFATASADVLDPLNSLIGLTSDIRNIQERRNEMIHEIATDIGRREKQMMDDAMTAAEAEPEMPTWERTQEAIAKTSETINAEIATMKAQFVRWYALLMKAINEAYVFEHHRRK